MTICHNCQGLLPDWNGIGTPPHRCVNVVYPQLPQPQHVYIQPVFYPDYERRIQELEEQVRKLKKGEKHD